MGWRHGRRRRGRRGDVQAAEEGRQGNGQGQEEGGGQRGEKDTAVDRAARQEEERDGGAGPQDLRDRPQGGLQVLRQEVRLFGLIPEKWPEVDEDLIDDLGEKKR